MQVQPLASESFEPQTADVLEFPQAMPAPILEPSKKPSRIPAWTKPMSSSEIAAILVSHQRNISNWYQKAVKKAYCWLPESSLRLGRGKNTRYTSFCCFQFEALAQVGEDGYELWIKSVHEANPNEYANWLQTQATKVEPETTEVTEAQLDHESDMVPYQPQDGELERFTPPARKLRQFVSTAAFVSTAKQHTETALDITQSNSDALTDALVNQMEQEGQKLGLTLFQAKYGTAQTVMADLEETLAKKSGLVEATPPPLVGIEPT